jgi:acyl carrier protein
MEGNFSLYEPWGYIFSKQVNIPQENPEENHFRKATAEGILRSGHRSFYLTSAHAFDEPLKKDATTAMSELDDTFEINGQSELGDIDEDSVAFTSRASATLEHVSPNYTSSSKSHTSPAPLPIPSAQTTSSIKAVKPPQADIASKGSTAELAADSIASHAMEVIANKMNIPQAELTDEVAFTELGVGSVAALHIVVAFRAILGLPISSTVFIDYPTVGKFKAFVTHSRDDHGLFGGEGPQVFGRFIEVAERSFENPVI